jgi:hypothetical protein
MPTAFAQSVETGFTGRPPAAKRIARYNLDGLPREPHEGRFRYAVAPLTCPLEPPIASTLDRSDPPRQGPARRHLQHRTT